MHTRHMTSEERQIGNLKARAKTMPLLEFSRSLIKSEYDLLKFKGYEPIGDFWREQNPMSEMCPKCGRPLTEPHCGYLSTWQ